MLKLKGVLVQAKDKYVLYTVINQAGKQTLNCDAKVEGGIKKFATHKESVLE